MMDHTVVLTIALKLTLVMVCGLSAKYVEGNVMTELVDSLNSRMLLMKDVAGYKAEHHAPVEDLTREVKVLTQSKCEAEHWSLDPSTTTTFTQALMDVGKAIQYRYLADWLSEPERTWKPPQDLENVRTNITDLDRTILCLVSLQIRGYDGFGEEQKAGLMERLSAPNIKAADKNRLVNSLGSIAVASASAKAAEPQFTMCYATR